MTAILPGLVATFCNPPEPFSSQAWLYEVKPSHSLPTLDLSLSLKSRFLSSTARRRFDRFMRGRVGVLVAYACTIVLYTVVMVTPPRVGQVLSVVALLLGIPGTVFVISALRYDALRVLLPTYDIIFFDSIVLSTLAVLMAMLNDARVLVILQALVAYQINIFIDANIQAVRRVAIMNSFAMMMTAFVGIGVALGIVPNLTHFVVFQYGSHSLDARSFVTDGFTTIVAIMLRNTYRKKAILLNRSTGAVVDCVSYRCHLAIQPFVQPAMLGPKREDAIVEIPPRPPNIQTMRYVSSLPLLDARRVLVPQFFLWLVGPSRARVKRLFFRAFGISAATLAIGTGFYGFAEFKTRKSMHNDATASSNHEHAIHLTLVVAVILTLLYTSMCCAVYQRSLLRAIILSFDFIFLSTQITFVHLATADFFQWNHYCIMLLATWSWCHWVLCIDALTPVARDRLGLSSTFTKLVMSSLVISTGILNHLLIFAESNITIYDRVIWSGTILGRFVEFRLLASFYSVYVTVMAWSLRLLWRIFTAKSDELVLLDGAVAFDNYLRQPPRKVKSWFLTPHRSIKRNCQG